MTTIEWTEESWNPLRARNRATNKVGHFCIHASPGCKGCYAERQQPRYGNPIRYAAQDLVLVEPFLDERVLARPLGWKRGREIFPCSMTDLFAPFHPDKWIDAVMAVAALTPQHTYQVLTKQADRMHKYFTNWPDGAARQHHVFSAAHALLNRLAGKTGWSSEDTEFKRAQEALKVWPLPNWHQGVSVENQEWADKRIPVLLKTKGIARRWISAEPLLDRVRLRVYLEKDMRLGEDRMTSLDWVVVGGESGPRARPFLLEWAEDLIEQCTETGVPIFMKQVGRIALLDGSRYVTKHSKGGDPTEWPEHLRVRERMAA